MSNIKKNSQKGKSRSVRAGLIFPVGRIHRFLREGNYSNRIGAATPVYLAAVLEFLVTKILELAGNKARANNRKQITLEDVQSVTRNDDEPESGPLFNIYTVILSKLLLDQPSTSAQTDLDMK